MTATRIASADLARLRRQPEPPFVLGILQYWRITTADQFKQKPDTTPCWTGSMGELLPILQQEIRQREIRGRQPLLYYLKDVQPAVRQALAEHGFAVVDQRLVPLARPTAKIEPPEPPPPDDPLDGLLHHASGVLQVLKQIILQGPPGTGKTYAAKRLAARLLGIGRSAVDEEESKTTGEFHDARFSEERGGNCWELVQFHPAYAYDDFVRGIQAKTTEEGGISYEVVRRVLDRLVEHHREDATTVLIIDEINRANLAQVLGELIYALEYRGSSVQTPYEIGGKGTLAIPREKFFIIGTMNTADRSVGRIDYAVRRRFAFLQLDPKLEVILRQDIREADEADKADKAWAARLFESVSTLFDAPLGQRKFLAQEFHPDDVRVGHTYFLGRQSDVRIKFAYQVYPLLREYYKDGVLLAPNGKIEFLLPGGVNIDLVMSENQNDLLSKLDQSWRSS
jgi:Cdc6-like AAA superfamily ATPase